MQLRPELPRILDDYNSLLERQLLCINVMSNPNRANLWSNCDKLNVGVSKYPARGIDNLPTQAGSSFSVSVDSQQNQLKRAAYNRYRINNIRREGGTLDRLVEGNWTSEQAYFLLNSAIVGSAAGPMGSFMDFIPASDPDNSEFSQVDSTRYREVRVGSVASYGQMKKLEFVHPDLNSVNLAACRSIFAFTDWLIREHDSLNLNSEEFAIVTSNIELFLNLLHPATNGSGRTTAEFLRYVYCKSGRPDLPNISQDGWMKNGDVQTRVELELKNRDFLEARMKELLGGSSADTVEMLQTAYTLLIPSLLFTFLGNPTTPLFSPVHEAALHLQLTTNRGFTVVDREDHDLDRLAIQRARERVTVESLKMGADILARISDDIRLGKGFDLQETSYIVDFVCAPMSTFFDPYMHITNAELSELKKLYRAAQRFCTENNIFSLELATASPDLAN